MISLFSIPKPCLGHIGVIQDNAFRSWKALGLDVTLLGDDQGVAEAAAAHGFRHIADIEKNSHGTPLVSSVFRTAVETAGTPLIAYVNADILLFQDFVEAIARIDRSRFLLVGRRTNLDVSEAADLSDLEIAAALRRRALEHGEPAGPTAIDFFVFPPQLYANNIPDFAIGRFHWDNWLIFHAARSRAPVIDASASILAIHQNHGYGADEAFDVGAMRRSEEARINKAILGGNHRAFDLLHAGWALELNKLRKRRLGDSDLFHWLGSRLAGNAILFALFGSALKLAEKGIPEAVKRPLRKFALKPSTEEGKARP